MLNLEHEVIINVVNEDNEKLEVVHGGYLPAFLTELFLDGDCEVFILKKGTSVKEVSIKEVK